MLRGQIAHIDRDASNSTEENGAYLCKHHHDEYDIVAKQSVRVMPEELKEARAQVFKYISEGGLATKTLVSGTRKTSGKRSGVSLAVYERRLPIYQRTIEFIRYVLGAVNPKYPEIIKFGRETEEALFLFDEAVAAYLQELSRHAVRLQAVVKMREAATNSAYPLRTGNFEAWINEETGLVTRFTEQYDVARAKFVPFLRLENSQP